jgi:hypothetical protein
MDLAGFLRELQAMLYCRMRAIIDYDINLIWANKLHIFLLCIGANTTQAENTCANTTQAENTCGIGANTTQAENTCELHNRDSV